MIIQFNQVEDAQKAQKVAIAAKKIAFVHQDRVAYPQISQISEIPNYDAKKVKKVYEKHPTYVKSSRLFHPEDTIILTPHSKIGGNNFTLMAGPDSIESAAHVLKMAQAVHEIGGTVLRGGSFKPRTSPYTFQGLGEEGLKFHREAADKVGMDMVTEIMDSRDVDLVSKYTDIFQVGARNMQNFSLLKALSTQSKPILLKRGMAATIDDLLNAAEYLAAGGNDQIILVERGIRTFDNKYTRNTFDVGAIPVLKQLTHYPVIGDPSHAAGFSELVTPIALAACAAGAQGLIIEIHDHPKQAFVDGRQALTPDQLKILNDKAQAIHQLLS